MKVVWLCHFSNSQIREQLDLKIPWFEKLVRFVLHLRPLKFTDSAQWNTNAINQFNKLAPKGVELYVVATHQFMQKKVQSFSLNGVHYDFYNDRSLTFWHFFKCRLLRVNDRFIFPNQKTIFKHI